MSIVSEIKKSVVPKGQHERMVRFGPLRGVRFNLDLSCQTQIWLGLYEREIYRWMAPLSNGIQSAIDIGAAEGLYTSYFLLRTSAKRVWSFEPGPGLRAAIARNLDLNAFREQEQWMFIPSCVGTREGMDVPLGSLCNSICYPCLIKVDVDGGELDVIRSASDLVARGDVRWIVETHSQDLESACLQFFAGLGYRTQVVANAWWRFFVPERRPIPHNRWLVAYQDGVV
jgi:hypothetical protein